MLVFTSFGFRSSIVKEKLESVVKTHGKTALIVPFAGYNSMNCAINEKNGLIDFGFNAQNVYVCDGRSAFDREYDYIYVPGGHTFKLLKEVQCLGLMSGLKMAVNNGATYIGVSAGAQLATPNLEYARVLERDNYLLSNYDGLSLIDSIIIPHADQHFISNQMHAFLGNIGDTRVLRIANDEVAVCVESDDRIAVRII